MKDLLKRSHTHYLETFDLGSPLQISITIENEKAFITNTNEHIWGKEIDTSDIGYFLAQTILLRGLSAKNLFFGNWLNEKDLPDYNKILDYSEEDFGIEELDLIKLWFITRTICNNLKKDIIYQIDYDSNYGLWGLNELKNKEEIERFINSVMCE